MAVAIADDADAEAVVRQFSAQGYSVFSIVEQPAMKRLATARLSRQPPAGEASVIVDLLFASSGIEPEVAQQAESIAILAGIEVPVARTGHLLALTVLSRSPERPQDSADLTALLQVLDAVERDRAVDAARLIGARGFRPGQVSGSRSRGTGRDEDEVLGQRQHRDAGGRRHHAESAAFSRALPFCGRAGTLA